MSDIAIDHELTRMNQEFYSKPFKVEVRVENLTDSSKFGVVRRRKYLLDRYYGSEKKPVIKSNLIGIQKAIKDQFQWIKMPTAENLKLIKEAGHLKK